MQDAVAFILEIEKLKSITRKIRPLGLTRFENPAEHSWQLALSAMSLARHAVAPVDIDRVVRMLLIHDLGEIDTGDTSAFVEGGWEERKADELKAVTRIFSHLEEPLRSDFLALWREFEAGQTDDARFANAIDRAMPVVLNLHNNGQSWRENGISYEQVVKRVRWQIEGGCPALWAYLSELIEKARQEGWFGMESLPR